MIRGPERMMREIKTDTEIEKVMCVEMCVSQRARKSKSYHYQSYRKNVQKEKGIYRMWTK